MEEVKINQSIFNYDIFNYCYNLKKLNIEKEYLKNKDLNSGIYIIINILNNKKYIGSSCRLKKRIREHLRDLINGNHINIKLQNSINKYGLENFEIKYYLYNDLDRISLFSIEEFLINHFNTYKIGYNMSDLARGRTDYSEEEKKIIGERLGGSTRGIPKTKEHKEKCGKSISITNSGEGNPLAKLSEQDVIFIRNNAEKYTCDYFSKLYNVEKKAIRDVIHLRSWKSIIIEGYNPPIEMKRSSKVTLELCLLVKKYREEGLIYKDISEKVGLCSKTIQKIIKQELWRQ